MTTAKGTTRSTAKTPASNRAKSTGKTTPATRATTRKASTATKTTAPTASKTAPKTATPTTAAPRPATPRTRAPATPAAPAVVAETVMTEVGPEMKKQELIDKVVRRTGMKRRDVKPMVEAMLGVLGEAIREGRALNVEPLGKMKVNRVKQVNAKRISVLKLRQADLTEKDPLDPIAPAAE